MRKFISIIMMTLFTVSISAQTVHESKMFDNVYTTVSAGVTNPTTNINWFNNTRPEFVIEVGKQVTTLYTTGLEFTSGINTTGVKTAFDDMSLLWLHKFNVTNSIWGYRPNTKWDFNVVGGLGWGHDMVIRDNYGIVQAGVEVAYNFNDTWSIIAKPNIEWNRVNNGLNVNHSDLNLSIGISYKFPNRGFKLCKEKQLYSQIDMLNERINVMRKEAHQRNTLIANMSKQIDVLKNRKPDTIVIDNTIAPIVGFVINSAELTVHSNAYLYQVAQDNKYNELVVKGYADAQTGNSEYNMELSRKRAEVVKSKLIEYGATKVSIEANGDKIQPFADNDMNRVAIVIKK